MPAVDPFSASSRPMNSFDSAPSDPLLFASTLQTIDPNLPALIASTSTLGLGRPSSKARQYNDPLPTTFPSPIWTRHSRASSFSTEVVAVGSDEWMDEQLKNCIDKAEPVLHLTHKGLTSLSTKIADLQHLVTFPTTRPTTNTATHPSSPRLVSSPSGSPSLPPHPSQSPGRDHFSADARPFARTVSAPAASTSFFKGVNGSSGLGVPRTFARVPSGLSGDPSLLDSPTITETSEDAGDARDIREVREADGLRVTPSLPESTLSPRQRLGGARAFGRSHTRAVLPMGQQSPGAAENTKGPMVWLQHNLLTTLPSALFEISNLTVLSLAHNRLTILPPAIGALHALTELNIGSNKIEYLPSTILSLTKLDNLLLNPNKFLPPPSEPDGKSVDGGLLGPLTKHYKHPIPSLVSLCTSVLISPRHSSGQPPLLEHDSYEAEPGCPHPLLDAATMQAHIPAIREADISRVLQSARSISTHLDAQAKMAGKPLNASGRTDLFPNLNRATVPDDAAKNPYFDPCPSPRHKVRSLDAQYEPVVRQLYLKPAEERMEWREVHRWPNIPVKWSGCSPGCLMFLEKDAEDEWTLDEEDEGEL